MSKILIKNGRIIDPETKRDEVTDILVIDDKIAEIGKIEEESGMNVIDATDKIVIPGIIDLHVHLRDMDQSNKETIETGTKAARKGGITTVFCMPNTSPKLDSLENIKKYQEIIDKDARIDTYIVGAITKELMGEELAQIDEYKSLGIKFITDDGFDIDDEELLEKAYIKAKELGMTVMTHPEIMQIAPNGAVNEGEVSKELNLAGQPNEKEWKAVERGIKLALKVGAKAHFTHLSTKESIELIRKAKKESSLITCDVTPHHFCLTENEVLKFGSQAKVNPPLRTEEDRLALIEGIKDGTVDAIVTDHAPHADSDKTDDIQTSAFGFSEIEVSAPASITELHINQGMDLIKVIELMTIKPAKLANITTGRLQKGYDADIVIIDMNEKEVDKNDFVSKGKNTPFHEKALRGWPKITIVKGQVF